MIRGIRGAITVENDIEPEISEASLILFQTMMEKNQLSPPQVVTLFITATPDIHSAFPARAIREQKPFQRLPILCSQEMEVNSALPRCIRMLALVEVEEGKTKIEPVYLRQARSLRKDLVEDNYEKSDCNPDY